MTGHAAAAAIREADPEGAIAMLAAEPERPYARPPLTKGLWLGKPEESVWLSEVSGVDLHLGRRAVALDPHARTVNDDHGEVYRYDRLLLATGGTPRRLPVGGERILYYRTLADYRRLRAVPGRDAVVIGGGFIGSEIAAALAQNGKAVTMIFPEEAVGARAYPKDLAAFVTRTFEQKGVRVLAGDAVAAVGELGERTLLRTAKGEELVADAVVAGLGIRPETALADAAGIRCGDGIEVDERLETSAPGVFAAGDVARFPCAPLGERIRVEHEDAALTMGRAAGRNMAGDERALPPPAVLLLGHLRARLRGGWSARREPRDGDELEDPVPRGRRLLRGGRPRPRSAALGDLRSGGGGEAARRGRDGGAARRARRRDPGVRHRDPNRHLAERVCYPEGERGNRPWRACGRAGPYEPAWRDARRRRAHPLAVAS